MFQCIKNHRTKKCSPEGSVSCRQGAQTQALTCGKGKKGKSKEIPISGYDNGYLQEKMNNNAKKLDFMHCKCYNNKKAESDLLFQGRCVACQ